MIHLHLIAKQLATALLFCAALMLSACAPGTGGTGTGPVQLSSPILFASASANNPVPGTITSPTANACETAAAQSARLLIQTTRIELSSPCATFTFVGSWSLSAQGASDVVGIWETSPAAGAPVNSSQTAAMTLSFLAEPESSSQVRISIKASAGQLLLGPIDLQRSLP